MAIFNINDPAAELALNEIVPSLSLPDCEFFCEPTSRGLYVRRDKDIVVIGYCDRRALLRAVALAAAHRDELIYSIDEAAQYDLLCAMPDASRNAVPTVKTLKKFFRTVAAQGYNAVMLYAEDVYELEKYPYFGHLRGRYTKEELSELDDYAELLGLEMIPAVQTLAHLNAFFEWPASAELCDCNDILLVGEEKTYAFIDEMLSFMSSTLRSRKINIGFDEAFMLGSGKYLGQNGYKPRIEIMLAHLSRVIELCKKHGYEVRMWSDMFFRTQNGGVYRVPSSEISPRIAALVPPEVTLVYWDYYGPDTSLYDEMFRQHKAFKNPIAFAGGDSSWYGPIPLSRFSLTCSEAATESLKKNNIREVYVTMWRDDGAACSLFSSLPTLCAYAEACWGHPCPIESTAGMVALEDMYDLPNRQGFGKTPSNPGKYIFYENILHGKFDCHIPTGSAAIIEKAVEKLEKLAEDAGEYQYIFDTAAAFGRVLAKKAEFGKSIYEYYHKNDRCRVKALAEEIPELIELIKKFRILLREQWLCENKTFGFDVLDIRIGGLIAELDTSKLILFEWANGDRERIDELDAPRLPYGFEGDKGYDSGILLVNRWERIAGANISNMF